MTCHPRTKQVLTAQRQNQRPASLGPRAAPPRNSRHPQVPRVAPPRRSASPSMQSISGGVQAVQTPRRAASPRNPSISGGVQATQAQPRRPVARARSGFQTPQTSRTVIETFPPRSPRSPRRGILAGTPALSVQSSPRLELSVQSSPRLDVPADIKPTLPLGSTPEVHISGTRFAIFEALGHGSFGAVWRAVGDGVGEVAVKEILCRSDSELCRASFEVRLLQLLNCTEPVPDRGTGEVVHRTPALVASDVDRIAEGWRLRLAMSRVPGEPLEEFLAGWRKTGLSMEPQKQFEHACRFVGEMLVQLAPTLEQFSSQVYHRDVTPRNILVQVPQSDEQEPQFGIVDFGLAVNAAQWRSNPAMSDLGGDGHYWPVSAWYVFGYGTDALRERAHLYEEYRTCLDVHGLGISALRVLMELLPCLRDERVLDICEDETTRKTLSKLRGLYKVWFRYWGDARRFWQPVFDSFKYGGDFDELKTAYVRAGVHRVVSSDLCALRGAMIQARLVCLDSPPELGLAGMSALFDALLLMVRPGRERDETPWCLCPPNRTLVESASVASVTASPATVCRGSPATLNREVSRESSQETLPPKDVAVVKPSIQDRGRSPKKAIKESLRQSSQSTEPHDSHEDSLSSSAASLASDSSPAKVGSPVRLAART